MSKKNDSSLPEKYMKVIDKLPEFKDKADAAGVPELKELIITAEGHIYTIDQAKEADVKLQGAKELVKEHSEPYRDALKVQTAKIKYLLACLESKGVDLDSGD